MPSDEPNKLPDDVGEYNPFEQPRSKPTPEPAVPSDPYLVPVFFLVAALLLMSPLFTLVLLVALPDSGHIVRFIMSGLALAGAIGLVLGGAGRTVAGVVLVISALRIMWSTFGALGSGIPSIGSLLYAAADAVAAYLVLSPAGGRVLSIPLGQRLSGLNSQSILHPLVGAYGLLLLYSLYNFGTFLIAVPSQFQF